VVEDALPDLPGEVEAGAVALVTGTISAEEVPALVPAALGDTPGQWTATLVHDVVVTSLDSPEVALGTAMEQVHGTLREFLGERVHARPAARSRGDRAVHCLRSLVVYLLEHPDGLPRTGRSDDPLVVSVLDEVSALTDGRALAEFRRLFLPQDD
jgi:dGTPase